MVQTVASAVPTLALTLHLRALKPISFSLFFVILNLLTFIPLSVTKSTELTFELPDNQKECFYEVIEKGVESTVEFQVVTGGNYDVDVVIQGPTKQVLFQQVKQQYGQHTFTADREGEYSACFSNEFSTFTHKIVYMDFQVGSEEDPLPGVSDHATAMTQMESSSQQLHENLNTIADYQTHYRLRESQGRKRAEDLNERVMMWSLGETLAVLIIGVGQVVVLKNFFSEHKPSQMSRM